jgi:hypothetical protein
VLENENRRAEETMGGKTVGAQVATKNEVGGFPLLADIISSHLQAASSTVCR